LLQDAVFMICVGSVASVLGFGYSYLQAKRNEIKAITSQDTPQVFSYDSNKISSFLALEC